MRFSVAIPVRDGEQFLALAIESALAQLRPADEIIVLDDASTDASPAIARSSRWNNRVCYRRNERPTGFADAWNRAAAQASGDYVAILHQDDLLDPEYLLRVETALTWHPHVKHVYAACRYIDASGCVLRGPPPCDSEPALPLAGREYARRYLYGVTANQHIHRCPGVTTQRRLLLEQCAYRREAGHIADDDFFCRVGRFTDVVGLSTPLARYREHPASVTGRAKSLELVLARDWTFQYEEFLSGRTLFSADDGERILRHAARMLCCALVKGLHDERDDCLDEGLSLCQRLNDAAAHGAESALPPAWIRALLAGSRCRTVLRPVVIAYATMLRTVSNVPNLRTLETAPRLTRAVREPAHETWR